MDEAEFGVDDISEEEYNRLKEENMAKRKRKRKQLRRKRKIKRKDNEKGDQENKENPG